MPLFTFHQSRWSLFRPRKSRTFKAGCPTLLTECASGKDDGRFAQLRGHWAEWVVGEMRKNPKIGRSENIVAYGPCPFCGSYHIGHLAARDQWRRR